MLIKTLGSRESRDDQAAPPITRGLATVSGASRNPAGTTHYGRQG